MRDKLGAAAIAVVAAILGATDASAQYIFRKPLVGTSTLTVVPPRVKQSCAAFLADGDTASGTRTINPLDQGEFDVFCEQSANGGGWTLIGKFDGTTDETLTKLRRDRIPYREVMVMLNGMSVVHSVTCHNTPSRGFAADDGPGRNCTANPLLSIRVAQGLPPDYAPYYGNYGIYYNAGMGCEVTPFETAVWGRGFDEASYNGCDAMASGFYEGEARPFGADRYWLFVR